MDENAGGESECEKVSHRKSRREIEGRVVVVGLHIEFVLWCQDPSDVVLVTKLVVEHIGGDGEMGRMPGLPKSRSMRDVGGSVVLDQTYVGIIKDWNHDPVKDDKSSEYMNLSPPRDHKRAPNPCDL